MEDQATKFIERSAALDADVRAMCDATMQLCNVRGAVTIGICRAAMQHSASQRLLLSAGHHLTAMALVRLHYESVVRALWMQVGASDDWIAKFTTPMADNQLAEPVLGPPIDAMLDRLGLVAPPFVATALRSLKAASWAVMNSYVHSGVRAAAHSLTAFPASNIIAVLKNANALSMLNAQAYLLACNDPTTSGRLSEIQMIHCDCLP